MEIKEKISDVFNILHDGSIEQWWANQQILTLKVSCQYLAELRGPGFSFFFIDLVGIKILELMPWPDIGQTNIILTQYKDIFAGKLELLSAKILRDKVHIECNQRSKDLPYFGGVLVLEAENITIYDEAEMILTLEELNKLCTTYWERVKNR